jgi:hypothetical protein
MWLRFGATCCRPSAAGRPGRLRGANASGAWHGSAVFRRAVAVVRQRVVPSRGEHGTSRDSSVFAPQSTRRFVSNSDRYGMRREAWAIERDSAFGTTRTASPRIHLGICRPSPELPGAALGLGGALMSSPVYSTVLRIGGKTTLIRIAPNGTEKRLPEVSETRRVIVR